MYEYTQTRVHQCTNLDVAHAELRRLLEHLAVLHDEGAAVEVEPPTVAAPLVRVQVHAFGRSKGR